jgi:hypothetical protein
MFCVEDEENAAIPWSWDLISLLNGTYEKGVSTEAKEKWCYEEISEQYTMKYSGSRLTWVRKRNTMEFPACQSTAFDIFFTFLLK